MIQVVNVNGDEEQSTEDKDRVHMMTDGFRENYSCSHAGMGTRQMK